MRISPQGPRPGRRANLERLLRPKSIAVVGGRLAEEVIRQSRKLGFPGRIHAVNPHRPDLAGVPCARRLEDLPEAPDAVFLGVDREATVAAVGVLREMGAGGAVAYAAGFAEVADGVDLERRLVAVAGDLALVGPNCYGTLNLMERVALWPDVHGAAPVEDGVALVTQSGNIGITLTMQARGLPIAHVLSIGNQAVLKLHDYIEALADDPRIRAIGLYMETIPDLVAFARAALLCAERRIPLVAIKAGSSEAGSRTALGHTSSLAGAERLIDAYLARYGVVRVLSLADLVETCKLLATFGPLASRRIGSLSCSGGDAAMVADLAWDEGLELPPLPERTAAALAEVLGPRVGIGNPLDYHTYIWGDRERLQRCFAAMMTAGFEVTLLVLDYPRPEAHDVRAWDIAVEAMAAAVQECGGRGVVVASLPETMTRGVVGRIMPAGLVPMPGLPECLRALRRAAWLGEVWGRMRNHPPPLPCPPQAPAPDRATAGPAILLPEFEAKALLCGYGLAVPPGEVVAVAEAVAAARRIGFPVVLKTAATIAHKTEAGGVALDLQSDQAVAAAAAGMAGLGERVVVETMLRKPLVELIVGIDLDPQFGPYLLIGAGGTLVELIQDTGVLLLPVDPDEVRRVLMALRIAPILQGWRGQPPADLEAIVDAVCRLGAFALEHGQRILEVDLNPLMVYPAPHGVVVADALIRLRAPLEETELEEPS